MNRQAHRLPIFFMVGCADMGGFGMGWGAFVSVLFQYVGALGEQFCQYIVSILECSRISFGGYVDIAKRVLEMQEVGG